MDQDTGQRLKAACTAAIHLDLITSGKCSSTEKPQAVRCSNYLVGTG